MKRRHLIKAGGAGALALGASSAVRAEEEVFNWKLVMSWPKKFPGLATEMDWFVEQIKRVTNGRLNITIYGAGELVPAFEVFNAVSDGTAEMGHGAAYYWKGKIPEAELFTSVPFGLTPVEYNAWFSEGDGQDLLTELYKPFGVKPLLGGNSDYQMGGWFNKEINSLEDLQGLKIRMPGIGGEVFKRAGATVVSMPGGEIFTSMQSGVVDAADWVGPWNDQAFGLYKAAKYYYGGWQEPGSSIDLLFNEEAWNKLPEDIQAQVEIVSDALNQKMLSQFRLNNASSLKNLVENEGVELKFFPDDVVAKFKSITEEYLTEYAAQSDMAKKIADSYLDFKAKQVALSENEAHILRYRLP
ncbi:TRAP transporter substrate-binding protein [Suttonella sp. R2A3]|uniref:TRAP transporter substrate-binding protein n=1 Tax=Suttonella sp. R2A3 TaxID=2908648 RepID=UPI001F304B92|nr:TRAP transporter substrate-binding protein [Suttonella sp. R2A3]UJF24695.1 TRAP transporter substrate-binding protein [Suttonella sp. R2A3]